MSRVRRIILSVIFILGLFLFGLVPPRVFLSAYQQPAATNQDQLIAHFRAGQQEMQSGHFDQAVGQFKEVLKLRPDLAEARADLGLAYHALGDYGLAVAELTQAAGAKPDLLPAHLFLGLSYLKLGSPEKAIPALNRALTIDPANREAGRALATAELSVGSYGKAASLFRKLASAEPDKADAWFMLGRDYLRMAKSLTAQMSIQFRNSAWALRLAGDILGERRLYNDAAIAYRQALGADPAQPGLHAALGEMLLRSGKSGEADAEFNAELARDPLDPAALLGRAQGRLLEEKPQQALESIATIWRTAPEILTQVTVDFPVVALPAESALLMARELDAGDPNPARAFLTSALYRIAGDTSSANAKHLIVSQAAKDSATSKTTAGAFSRSACEQDLERACVAFLTFQKRLDAEDHLRLGRALLALHREEAASDAFAAARAQNQRSPAAMYWLIRSYLRLASDCFDELTAAYSDSWRAHELKGEALHLRQAEKDAIVEYRAAAALHMGEAEIHEALGELLLGQKEFAEAQAELETALRLNPAAARSLYLLGRLYAEVRKPADAVPYLEAALHYDPTLLEARPVLGKAYLKIGKPHLAAAQLEMSSLSDRYGNFHYLLYQAYRDEGKADLAARALARSQELRRKSEVEDQSQIPVLDEEQ